MWTDTQETQTDRRDEPNTALRNSANAPITIPKLQQHRSVILLSLPTLNETRKISRYCKEPLLYFCVLSTSLGVAKKGRNV
jgi:hypothetical protein